ncbi:MAG: hypothetical protein WCK89_11995, partial [bacterium]
MPIISVEDRKRAAGCKPAARSNPRQPHQDRAYCAGAAASITGGTAATGAGVAAAAAPVPPFPIRQEKNLPVAPMPESAHRDAHARTYGGSFDPEFV